MTFVNPEPLAPFADAIAAGEGEVLVPSLRRAFSAASDRADLLRRLSHERGFYIPSFYEPYYGPDGSLAGYHVSCGRADAGAQGGAQDDRGGRSAGDEHLHARHGIRLAPARSRSSAVARTCADSAGPATTTCRSVRFPTERILQLAEAARPFAKPRRARVDRALRSPGHRAHPRPAERDGLFHQPGLAAPRRSDRADRPRPPRKRRAHDHDCAGNRFRSAASRDQQDRHQRRDPRSRRPDFRERHREPEALLHARPPDRNGRGPGGDSRSDAPDARRHDEARALARPCRPHRRQREPADSQARHRLSMAGDDRRGDDRQEEQAPADA